MDLEEDMPTEKLEDSLWKGYFRQKLIVELLRSKKDPEGRTWTSYPQGDKFDLLGYTGSKSNQQNRIAVEVRFRNDIPENKLLQYGIYINKNKLRHAKDAYREGVEKCIMIAILNEVGVYHAIIPRDTSKLRMSTKTRDPSLNNSGNATEEVAYIVGFSKLASWDYYVQIATKYAPELLKIHECESTIRSHYAQAEG